MQASVGRVLLIVGLQFVTCQLLIAVVSSRSLQDDVGLNIDVNVIGERVIDENHNVIDYHLKNTAAASTDDRSPVNFYDYPSDSSRSFTNFDYDSFERRSKSADSLGASQLEQDSTASYRRGALGLAENIEEKQYGGGFNGETDAEKGQNYLLSIYPISQQQQHLLPQPQQQLPISQYYPQQQQFDGVAAVGAAGPQDLYFNPPAMQIPYPFYHTSSTMTPTTTTTTTTTTMAPTTTRASDDSSSDDSAEKQRKRKRKRVRPSVIIVKKVLPLSTSTYASG